jgi:hypothetical protein
MEEWIALVITAVGAGAATAGGALIGLTGARNISREERAAAAHAETLRAFSIYFGALVPVVSELREVPPVPESNLLVDAANYVDKRLRGEAGIYVAGRRREQALFGGRNRELSARLGAAYIDLKLRPLPASVRATVDEAYDYVERLAEQRTRANVAEWPGIHARLMASNDELRGLVPHGARGDADDHDRVAADPASTSGSRS